MANEDIKDAIERALKESGREAEVHVVEVTDYETIPSDNDDGNASTLLDRSLQTLDRMADDGMELVSLLQGHKAFMTNVFGQLSALILREGGMVRLTKAELNDAMTKTMMGGTWDGDVLVLTAKRDGPVS